MENHARSTEGGRGQSLVGKSPMDLNKYTWCLVLTGAHEGLSTPPDSYKEETKFNKPVLWEGTRARRGG